MALETVYRNDFYGQPVNRNNEKIEGKCSNNEHHEELFEFLDYSLSDLSLIWCTLGRKTNFQKQSFAVRNYILLVTICDPYLWFRFIYRNSSNLLRNQTM